MYAVTNRRSGLRRRAFRTAFTLIELLVVVSIIALLVAILLPSLGRAREQTKSLKCLANLRTIGHGVALYVQDHQILPGPIHPPIYRKTINMPATTQRLWFLLDRLAPFFSKTDHTLEYIDKISECPTAVGKFKDAEFRPASEGGPSGNPNWSHPFNLLPNTWGNTKPKYYFGWVNIGVTWEGFMNNVNGPNPEYHLPKPMETIKRASSEWMVGDAWWDIKTIRVNPTTVRKTLMGTWQLGNDDPTNNSNNPLPKSPYHGSGDERSRYTNLVFFDGHGGLIKGKDNWKKYPATNPQDAVQ